MISSFLYLLVRPTTRPSTVHWMSSLLKKKIMSRYVIRSISMAILTSLKLPRDLKSTNYSSSAVLLPICTKRTVDGVNPLPCLSRIDCSRMPWKPQRNHAIRKWPRNCSVISSKSVNENVLPPCCILVTTCFVPMWCLNWPGDIISRTLLCPTWSICCMSNITEYVYFYLLSNLVYSHVVLF